MKNKKTTAWCLMAIVGFLLVSAGTAKAQRLYLVVNRDSGSVEAVSSADVDVDGYSISSPAGRLNPDGWNSLTDQSVPGWTEANPRNELLSELNWEGASPLAARQPLSLGSPYNGGQIFPSEEDVGFQFTTPDGVVRDASVRYTGASQLPTITVNRESGLVELSNPAAFDITGYTIASPSGILNPDGLNGLADQNLEGWEEANPTNSLISELNLQSSLAFEPSSRFSLGNAYTGGLLVGEDLAFQYSTLEGDIADGLVDYTGPTNDLVLNVDLLSGSANIQNTSSVAGPFDIVGYSITSASGSLSVDNWTSFADTGAAGEGWAESNPRADAIAELNPTGSTLFDQNKSISIGNILAGIDDLVFEYGLSDGTAALGTVEYVLNLGAPTPGDCNGDGVLDAADLACVSTIEERDLVLGALNTLPGDLDGNGDVAFPDFLTLSANFGQDLPSYTAGNIDLTGGVAFPDFLTLSANFGQTPGGAAASVPEPASGLLAAMGMLFLLAIRKRR